LLTDRQTDKQTKATKTLPLWRR